jgi:hypothetical protein
MHRTVATLRRPEPHVFVEDPDVPPDHKGRRFCRAVVNSTDGSALSVRLSGATPSTSQRRSSTNPLRNQPGRSTTEGWGRAGERPVLRR